MSRALKNNRPMIINRSKIAKSMMPHKAHIEECNIILKVAAPLTREKIIPIFNSFTHSQERTIKIHLMLKRHTK